jgi:nickel-dependent lactate racemase
MQHSTPDTPLTDAGIREIFATCIPRWFTAGERVLLVVPDTTRTAPMARMMGLLLPDLSEAGCRVTVLVALGTHPPLSPEALRNHLGIDPAGDDPRVMNHNWDDPSALMSVGTLSAGEVESLSGGLLAEAVELRVNGAVAAADRMLVLHPVFPHELVGFSGGSKYLFPGISGPEILDTVHWLGALCTSGKVIGRIDSPPRRVLDAAAEKMPLPMHGLAFVYHRGEVAALEAGGLREAWRRAAAVSKRLHVTYTSRAYRKVLACCPPMYPDLWTGSKCIYKCEPVVEDGGELIVYAPHATTFSEVHEATVRKLGYHVRDYFLAHMDRYVGLSRAVMAYCTIVKGDGSYENGIERPRIRVSFASGIPRSTCEAAGIDYVDPETIEPADWTGRENEGVLCVERAGEMLFRVKTDRDGIEREEAKQ